MFSLIRLLFGSLIACVGCRAALATESLALVKPETVIAWHRGGFRENHAREIVAVDMFVVPTIRFQILYIFVIPALGKDAPDHRSVEPPELGKVVALPRVGGLHHRYSRRAA